VYSRVINVRQFSFVFVAVLLCGTSHLQGACFRGRPLPECKTFWITESGVLTRFDRWSKKRDWQEHLYLSYEVGKMYNRNQHTEYGGSVLLRGADFPPGRSFGFKGRYRRWLSKETSLDLSPGIILDFGMPPEISAFSTSIAVCFQDGLV
jgi:hypothetical protein